MTKKVFLLLVLPIILYFCVGLYGIYSGSKTIGMHHVLIVNTWNDFPRENVTNVDTMPAQALYAYLVLKGKGYNDSEMELMLYHSKDNFIDVDGDGTNDLTKVSIDVENDLVNRENVKAEMERISNHSGIYDDVLIYIVSHGELIDRSLRAFSFENGDMVSSDDFSKWLDQITCKNMVVLLDFCFSGNFAGSIIKPGRLVISSAEDDKIAWYYWNWNLNETEKDIFGSSGSAFFHPFWKKIGEGATFQEAYRYGKEQCIRWGFIDTNSKNITQVQDPQKYVAERNWLEDYVFFFPGRFVGLFSASLAFVLVEIAVIINVIQSHNNETARETDNFEQRQKKSQRRLSKNVEPQKTKKEGSCRGYLNAA